MTVYLKEFRSKFNLTQKEAGESIGIDQRQWSRYENETNEFPIRYLKELCIKYNISADWLLGLPEKNIATTSIVDDLAANIDY